MRFQTVLYLLAGTVRIQVRGAAIERFLNLCSRHDIRLRRIVRIDIDELQASISVSDFRRLRQCMGRSGCHVHLLNRRGAPFVVHRFRKRYALMSGFLVLAALCFVLTNFIWSIDLRVPDGVSGYAATKNLQILGLSTGVRIQAVDFKAVRAELCELMPELSYVTMQLRGNSLRVDLFARLPKPVAADKEAATSVVASRAGVITKISAYEGNALKKVGDTVTQGEMLVSAVMPPTTEQGRARLVHAAADVEARTWHEITARRAIANTEKRYTGKEKTQFALVFGKKRVNLYFGCGISAIGCDKIVEESHVILANNLELPIRLVRQTYRYYDLVTERGSAAVTRAEMEENTRSLLSAQIDGTITKASTAFQQQGSGAELTLYAECSENIGCEMVDTQELPTPQTAEGE